MSNTFTDTEPAFLRLTDAAKLLGVSRETFRTLRAKPGFPAARYIGTRPAFARAELIAWVNAQTAPAAA